MHLPAGFLVFWHASAKVFPDSEWGLTIHVIQKDVLAPISAAHHKINGSGILNAQLSGDARLTQGDPTLSATKRQYPCYGLTPFLTPF